MDNIYFEVKNVSEMHSPTIWRSKFTDLVNSKKKTTQFLGKNGCRQKCLDKSLAIDIWDALHDLVPFVQFKKCEKHPGKSVLLVKLQALACKLTKSNTRSWVFSTFLKLCKWHQITLRISHIDIISTQWEKSCSKLTISRFVWSCSQLTLTVSKWS